MSEEMSNNEQVEVSVTDEPKVVTNGLATGALKLYPIEWTR